ncbi:MAG: tripartite tricarboxylate transporter TctB family protein [Albidovulum sp.]
MTNRAQDTVLGVVLVLIAGCWTWLVIATIPPGFGDGEIGPRAFPLAFGIIVIALAGLLLLRVFLGVKDGDATSGFDDAEIRNARRFYWLPALVVLGEIALYGFLLEKIGFVLATPIVVLLVMTVSLRVRSVPKLLGMSLGLTVGCWLIFEKILGIYLAHGTWLNLG